MSSQPSIKDVHEHTVVDPKDKKPTRVGYKVVDKDRKVRVARRSGEVID